MPIDPSLLEICQYTGRGYRPLIDYQSWRVAVLRYVDELLPQHITKFQRHDGTDEVFILLEGRCILFIGTGTETITDIQAQDMEPLKLYNVKTRCWHSHTLSREATVLVIENSDTAAHNSPEISLSPAQREQIERLTHKLWGGTI